MWFRVIERESGGEVCCREIERCDGGRWRDVMEGSRET